MSEPFIDHHIEAGIELVILYNFFFCQLKERNFLFPNMLSHRSKTLTF